MDRTSNPEGFRRRDPGGHRSAGVQFYCQGHRHIRGLHHKTFELTRETDITERATCVVGVAADYLPRDLARLRGPLEIELAVGGFREVLRAYTSPLPAVAETLVFRCSEVTAGRTFAWGADKAAKNLHRGLISALQDPQARLQVTIRPTAEKAQSVLLVASLEKPEMPGSGEFGSELRQALLASDVLVAPHPGPTEKILRRWGLRRRVLPCHRPRDLEELVPHLEAGCRLTILVAEADLTAEAATLSLVAGARELGAVILPVGVPPHRRALFASGLAAVPSLYLGSSPTAGAPHRGRQGSPGTTVFWSASAAQARREISAIPPEVRPQQVAVAWAPGSLLERFLTGSPEEVLKALAESDGREEVFLVLSPGLTPRDDEPGLPEPALLSALLAQGVPLRTLADALAAATGAPRRSQYQALLSLQGKAKAQEKTR